MRIGSTRKTFPIRLLAAALAASSCLHAAENYASWTHEADMVLNTSASGANVAGAVADFPALLRLTAANFPFSQARGRGQDIRFSKTDGAPLDYEIERWDSARAMAEVWVKVDTIRGNAAGQTFRMHWGNPYAADSSDGGAVFGAGNGFVAAWHLTGSGTAPRPNAVAGGNPATPSGYDGDENRIGIIAGADSLDGGAAGDHLMLGQGYADFSTGLTFSVWAYPTAVKKYSHILSLGNGMGLDNIILTRDDMTANLGFHNWNGSQGVRVTAQNQLALNQWQHFAVTVSGRNVRLYKDGVQVHADSMGNSMVNVLRTINYLGKSPWTGDAFFQGKLDQAELSRTARSADWIKLSHQNQKSGQNLVTLVRPDQCQTRFSAPPDTAADEGEVIGLIADVECANGFFWSTVSGPAPRILDPEVKILEVTVPRVTKDTIMVYRLSASFPDSLRTRDVRVAIRESIPEPVFTLPSLTWNGRDSLALKPAISNLAALRASPDSILNWAWTLERPEVDTAHSADGLWLRGPLEQGEFAITLCLDNNGPKVCRAATLTIDPASVGIRSGRLPAFAPATAPRTYRDAAGRLRTGENGAYRPDRYHRKARPAASAVVP